MNKKVIGAAAVLAVALAGCGGGAAVAGHGSPSATVTETRVVTAPPKVITVTPKPASAPAHKAPQPAPALAPPSNPMAVVTQFYADISAHDYSAAWALGGDNIGGTGYAGWVAGYQDTTASISLTSAENWGSGQVEAYISAVQLDGSVRAYYGTYTVRNGVIVSADITQLSGSQEDAHHKHQDARRGGTCCRARGLR
jgi:hypothetical protein